MLVLFEGGTAGAMDPVINGNPHRLVASSGCAVKNGEVFVCVGGLTHEVQEGLCAVALRPGQTQVAMEIARIEPREGQAIAVASDWRVSR